MCIHMRDPIRVRSCTRARYSVSRMVLYKTSRNACSVFPGLDMHAKPGWRIYFHFELTPRRISLQVTKSSVTSTCTYGDDEPNTIACDVAITKTHSPSCNFTGWHTLIAPSHLVLQWNSVNKTFSWRKTPAVKRDV